VSEGNEVREELGERHSRRRKPEDPAAFFVAYKPRGITSHDVVDRVRRLLGLRRVGHGGTLDPAAEGILVLGLGTATRLLRFLGHIPKDYAGLWVGGESTDTYDAEGHVVEHQEVGKLVPSDLYDAFASLVGPLCQRPPAYAAVRVGGRRMYDLARKGVSVEPPVREVYVHAVKVCPPILGGGRAKAGFAVRVSSGTYVRSLAVDAGKRLGLPAHLGALVRLRAGGFTLGDAWTLSQLEEYGEEARTILRTGTYREFREKVDGKPLLYSPAVVARLFPRVRLTPEAERGVRHGRSFSSQAIQEWEPVTSSPQSIAKPLLGDPEEREVFARLFCGSGSSSEGGAAFAAFAPPPPLPPEIAGLVAVVDVAGELLGLFREREDPSGRIFFPEVVLSGP